MTRPPANPQRAERGSAVVEVVLLAPALGLFIALVIAGGRVAIAHQGVEASAAQAARAASIARTQAGADEAARAAAIESLNAQDLTCNTSRVTLDTTEFAAPIGTPAAVSATVSCRVDLAGVLPALPGAVDITATARSPLDTYRER